MRPPKPQALKVRPEQIPAWLRQQDHWLMWRYMCRDGNWTKPPFQTNGAPASASDPKTWNTLEAVLSAYEEQGARWDGIGFGLAVGGGLASIDLDHCIDPETGEIAAWAQEIVEHIGSYTERSPSGTGIRIFVVASLPEKKGKGGGRKQDGLGPDKAGAIEMYDALHYLTVTGRAITSAPSDVLERQEAFTALYWQFFPKKAAQPNASAPPQPIDLDDHQLWDKMLCSRSGPEIRALFNGDTSRHDNDRSRADCALLTHLAWWTDRDEIRMDRMFRQSGLYRAKWEREDYRAATIAKAMEGITSGYAPRPLFRVTRKYTGRRAAISNAGSPPPAGAAEADQEAPPPGEEFAPVDAPPIQAPAPVPQPDPLEGLPKSGDEFLERLREVADAAYVFECMPLLARMEPADLGIVKTQIRAVLGRNINFNDFTASITATKRQMAQDEKRRQQEAALRAYRDASGGLPEVDCGDRPLREITKDAISALHQANVPPVLFSRSGALVRLVENDRRISVERLTEHSIRGMMTRTADYVIHGEYGPSHVSPPMDVARDLLTYLRWPFPILDAVVEAPYLRPDGTVVTTAGYDAATRTFYAPPPGLVVPPVPDDPTTEQISAATGLLWEMLQDFPFVADAKGADGRPLGYSASYANMVALLLTFILRHAVPGSVMLAVINKTTRGTGAALLCDLVAILATGQGAKMFTAPDAKDEWRKLLVSLLNEGTALIFLDNLDRPIDSPHLSSALTADTYSGRLTGFSNIVDVPQRATWVANGNNVQLRGDLPRRAYNIRLDAKTSSAYLRTGFKIEDLRSWTRERRGELLAALLTLCRAWWAAGCPKADTPVLGSFEPWCRAMGGILTYAGIPGFLANWDAMKVQENETSNQWEIFLERLERQFGAKWFWARTAATCAFEDADFRHDLPEELAAALERSPHTFHYSFGRALLKQVDVRYGEREIYIERAEDKSVKVALWRIAQGKEPEPCGVSPENNGVSPEINGVSEPVNGVLGAVSSLENGVNGVSHSNLNTYEETPYTLEAQREGVNGLVMGGENQTPKPRNPVTSDRGVASALDYADLQSSPPAPPPFDAPPPPDPSLDPAPQWWQT